MRSAHWQSSRSRQWPRPCRQPAEVFALPTLCFLHMGRFAHRVECTRHCNIKATMQRGVTRHRSGRSPCISVRVDPLSSGVVPFVLVE